VIGDDPPRTGEAGAGILALDEAMGKAEKAAEWSKRLAPGGNESKPKS